MEGYNKKVFIVIGFVLATFMMVAKANVDQVSPGHIICQMTQQGFEACLPSVTKTNHVPPSKPCCSAVSKANFRCLCKHRDSPLLAAYGVSPALAMALPSKCNVKTSFKCPA
ncbi:hypothetical protein BVRB_9g217850 [Beta vulgaris subsp. vulgaris]|uniref:putative lipid-transfer protein DIR1 n=1 Tax=Beta vulgaris subsp. vulgaris TaxID=3555 RepID=UPI00065C60C7|nr:putative lipid-transfer protein DIR1 [Beta vulgaris subsp. vulgaris]KMT00485.1 hypothetical protein BVRB_9g217850 [Beta vulgaris subsp. vulgaris]